MSDPLGYFGGLAGPSNFLLAAFSGPGGAPSNVPQVSAIPPKKPDHTPLATWEKWALTIACLAGLDPNYATPLTPTGRSPQDSADTTEETGGQRNVYGPTPKGGVTPYNPSGGQSQVPDNTLNATQAAVSTGQCIANVWQSW